MSILEGQTHKVIDLLVGTIVEGLVVTLTDSLVYDIPSVDLALELLHSSRDKVLHEELDLLGIILVIDVRGCIVRFTLVGPD